MIKKENGITLIALIITIIVMLILVAVTITMAVRGGLFGYAGNAAKDTEAEKQKELGLANGVVSGKTIEQIVNGGSTPTLNEYGFYYETPYSVMLAQDLEGSIVFKETGTIELYQNGVPYSTNYWSLQFTPQNKTITLNSIDCTVSEDGKTITVPGTLMSAMTGGQITGSRDYVTTFEEYHDIYYNTIYYSRSNYVDWEGFLFEGNGNLNIANGWYIGTPNIQQFYNIKYEITTSHLKNLKRDGENTGQLAVSMDGKHIIGSQGSFGEGLAASMELEYPWIAPWNDNRDGILNGTPEDCDKVIYEKYYYQYSESDHAYTAYLRDQTQTYDSYEILSDIFGVPVIDSSQSNS